MRKFKEVFVNSFFYALAIELVEETIEDFIAMGFSIVITKAFSALIVVTFTQSTKLVIKRLVKKITYKEGNDKVNKLKNFFSWIWSNKKSLLGTIGGLVSGVATAIATNSDAILALPELLVFNFNLTPILAGLLVFAGVEVGVVGKGFEWVSQYKARKEAENAEKERKAILKEAKKEIAEAQKKATQTQAEKEKAEAKAKAEELAKKEKEKADAEHRAKVEEVKKQLLAQNNNQNA